MNTIQVQTMHVLKSLIQLAYPLPPEGLALKVPLRAPTQGENSDNSSST